ncbi:MAG: NAD(P)-binding protein [Candidatus Methylacidiphilales bacterium]|nr:NAD(P)-binding protein [Candidatus Methylacidiphilales bacterium]
MLPPCSFLVAGGGIAGMLSARTLAEAGARVTIVERNAALGGLLASRTFEREEWVFDYGTHLPEKLGIADLDRRLFGRITSEEWLQIPFYKTGNYAFGQLNEISGNISLHSLGKELHDSISSTLIQFPDPVAGFEEAGGGANLKDYVTAQYGQQMAEHVFSPIMKKFYGHELSELSPVAHHTFGLFRFLAYDPESSIKLKENPAIDSRLAFHSSSHGVVGRTSYYPRTGGIGEWTRLLAEDLEALGVQVITEDSITALAAEPGDSRRLCSATLKSGKVVNFNHLIWTLPAAMLLRLTGHAEAAQMTAPKHSRISLYHFVLDKPPVSPLFYMTCFDPEMETFRVTLYDNVQGTPVDGVHRITVEVLTPTAGRATPSIEKIFNELSQIGLISSDTKAIASFQDELSVGFPIFTPAFINQTKLAQSLVERDYSNVSLFGRNGGSVFFMRDVLVDIHDRLPMVMEETTALANAGTGR